MSGYGEDAVYFWAWREGDWRKIPMVTTRSQVGDMIELFSRLGYQTCQRPPDRISDEVYNRLTAKRGEDDDGDISGE